MCRESNSGQLFFQNILIEISGFVENRILNNFSFLVIFIFRVSSTEDRWTRIIFVSSQIFVDGFSDSRWINHRVDHTKVAFWWSYRQHSSPLVDSLMNLRTAICIPFPQLSELRWIYHRGRSHKTDVWIDLPAALFNHFCQSDRAFSYRTITTSAWAWRPGTPGTYG